MKRLNVLAAGGLSLSLILVACSGDKPISAASEAAAQASETSAAAGATGEVIEVKMITDGQGNYFDPAEITAESGDILRFTLVSGVHNVSFPPAENAGAAGLPAPSPYLQLPGQTQDVVVDLPAGQYTFQCDPHAVLGMKGKLTVR